MLKALIAVYQKHWKWLTIDLLEQRYVLFCLYFFCKLKEKEKSWKETSIEKQ